MIAADLELLEFQRKKEITAILEKELDYISRDLSGMTASASFFGGFVYQALSDEEFELSVAGVTFSLVATLAMIVNMVLVVYSTFLVMFGPNCALHTKDDKELRKTVMSLRDERMLCLKMMVCGVMLFMFSSMCSWWKKWPIQGCSPELSEADHCRNWFKNTGTYAVFVVCMLLCSFGFFAIYKLYQRIMKKYKAPSLIGEEYQTMLKGIRDGVDVLNVFHHSDKHATEVRTGFLTIKTEVLQGDAKWSIKFFQLMSDRLRYSNLQGSNTQGTIKFSGAEMLTRVQELSHESYSPEGENNGRFKDTAGKEFEEREFVFQVECGGETWILQAQSEEEKNEWMESIREVVDHEGSHPSFKATGHGVIAANRLRGATRENNWSSGSLNIDGRS